MDTYNIPTISIIFLVMSCFALGVLITAVALFRGVKSYYEIRFRGWKLDHEQRMKASYDWINLLKEKIVKLQLLLEESKKMPDSTLEKRQEGKRRSRRQQKIKIKEANVE